MSVLKDIVGFVIFGILFLYITEVGLSGSENRKRDWCFHHDQFSDPVNSWITREEDEFKETKYTCRRCDKVWKNREILRQSRP